jgi:uncharacterized membrane protein
MLKNERNPDHVPAPLERGMRALESWRDLDPIARRASEVAGRVSAGTRGALLRGNWLGHAVHPLMTDFPLGCWLSAGLLDLSGAKRFRPAARRLVGLGVAFAVPTAVTGLADYGTIDDPRARRVGVVHAIGNTGVLLLYGLSWRARRRGHHGRGVALAMAGGSGAWITGYLGGHLSFARRVGTGQRGMDLDGQSSRATGGEDIDAEDTDGEDRVREALLANGAVPAATAGGEHGLAGPNSL